MQRSQSVQQSILLRFLSFMTVALGCALLLAAAGCDSAVDPDVKPPETLSAEAFQMQTELFEDEEAPEAQSLEAAGEEYAHFTAAATRVGVVSTVEGSPNPSGAGDESRTPGGASAGRRFLGLVDDR